MRKTITSLAFIAVMAIAMGQAQENTNQTTTSQNQQPSVVAVQPGNGQIAVIMKNNNLSWEDAAATIALARALNMDPAAIVAQRSSMPNVSMYQLAPAFIIQQQSGKPFADVYAMYTGGQTWMQIGTALNVPASYWNPSNVTTTSWTNDDYDNGVWQAILMKNYGMSADDAVFFGTNKTPMNEVVVGEVVARQDNTPIRDVMSAYGNNHDWGSIDQQFALNQNAPANQSQVTSTAATTTTAQTPTTQPAPTDTTNQQPAPATTTPTPTTTQTDTNSTAQTTNTTNNMSTPSATVSPVEEWQVSGANINPYNGWANVTTTNSSYTLHRHHRRHRRSRHHRRSM